MRCNITLTKINKMLYRVLRIHCTLLEGLDSVKGEAVKYATKYNRGICFDKSSQSKLIIYLFL